MAQRYPTVTLPSMPSLPPAPGQNRGAETGLGRIAGRWVPVGRPGSMGKRGLEAAGMAHCQAVDDSRMIAPPR